MQTDKNEILKLERRYWEAMKNKDVETAVSLTKFPCIVASPKGAQKISENEYRQIMQSSQSEHLQGIEIQNPQVEVLSNDTMMISYSIEMNGMKMLDVSTWVRENDKWVCAFHSENPQN